MITTETIFDVLQKASAYAPDRVPAASEATVLAWCEHFDQFPQLTRDDVLEAVTVFYRDAQKDHLLQPADISKTARALHQDQAMRELPANQHFSHDDDNDDPHNPDEHPPGDPCAVEACPKPSTFAQYCARHYVLSKVGLVGKTL